MCVFCVCFVCVFCVFCVFCVSLHMYGCMHICMMVELWKIIGQANYYGYKTNTQEQLNQRQLPTNHISACMCLLCSRRLEGIPPTTLRWLTFLTSSLSKPLQCAPVLWPILHTYLHARSSCTFIIYGQLKKESPRKVCESFLRSPASIYVN